MNALTGLVAQALQPWDDFELSPFAQEGGIGKVYQLFGAELPTVLEALNKELAA